MGKSGLLWVSNSPAKLAQRFSMIEDNLPGKAEGVVQKVVEEAADVMRKNIRRGGENQTKKGGARVLNGDMIDSVEGKVSENSRGRTVGQFGFSESTPRWTLYQERGTRRGIAPMYAYVEAQVYARAAFPDEIDRSNWFDVTTLQKVTR